jgi:hypothetical protein
MPPDAAGDKRGEPQNSILLVCNKSRQLSDLMAGTLKLSRPTLRRIIVVRLIRRCHVRFSSVVWNGSSASLMGCDVRSTSDSDRIDASQRTDAMCHQRPFPPTQESSRCRWWPESTRRGARSGIYKYFSASTRSQRIPFSRPSQFFDHADGGWPMLWRAVRRRLRLCVIGATLILNRRTHIDESFL